MEAVANAINALNMKKSARVDIIPTEVFRAGSNTLIDALTSVCNTTLKTREWSFERTVPGFLFNKEQKQLHRTISLMSHQIKVTLKIIVSIIQPQRKQKSKECAKICKRSSWFKSMKEHQRANIQCTNPQSSSYNNNTISILYS